MQIAKWNITSVVLAFVVLLSLMSGIVANAEDAYRTEVTNIVEVGEVDIGLNVYTHDENGLPVPLAAQQKVHPGQDVDMLVTVSNLANDAWIRIRPAISSDSGLEMIDESLLTLDADAGWIRIGSYYYLSTPLAANESVTFMRGLTVPSTIKNADSGRRFTVDLVAEAVQTKNFTPDFTSDDPWFGTVIEACVHNTKSDYDYGSLLSVEFENGAEGLVKYGDDVIHMWGTLMPGDTISDSIQLANRYEKAVDMYFRIEKLDESELLSQLDLTITYNGNVLYEGKMDGSVMDRTLLTVLHQDDVGELDFTIHVPETLDNVYALSATSMKWIFTADLHDEPATTEESTEPTETTTAVTEPGTADPPRTVIDRLIDSVKTGVASPVVQVLMLCGALGIMAAVRPKRKKTDEDEASKNDD